MAPSGFATSGQNAYDGLGHLVHTESQTPYQTGSPEEEYGRPPGQRDPRGVLTHDPQHPLAGEEGFERSTYQAGTGRILAIYLSGTGDPNDNSFLGTSYHYDLAGNTDLVIGYTFVLGSDGTSHTQVERRRTWYNAAEQVVAVDRRVCQFRPANGTQVCDTTLALDYTDRPTFEEYRYDALGRRILVRTREDWNCQSRCMETLRRVLWDRSAIAAEVSAPGATGTLPSRMEADTGLATPVADWIHGAEAGFFTGRVVYVNGPSLDRPLALYRVEYSDSIPEPVRLLPVTNWQGHYDWQFGSPTCRTLTGESSAAAARL